MHVSCQEECTEEMVRNLISSANESRFQGSNLSPTLLYISSDAGFNYGLTFVSQGHEQF